MLPTGFTTLSQAAETLAVAQHTSRPMLLSASAASGAMTREERNLLKGLVRGHKADESNSTAAQWASVVKDHNSSVAMGADGVRQQMVSAESAKA